MLHSLKYYGFGTPFVHVSTHGGTMNEKQTDCRTSFGVYVHAHLVFQDLPE